MDTEFEAKFYPVNKNEIREALTKIGAKMVKSERKMRRVISNRRAYPQLKCDYIRIRDEGEDMVRLSAKVHALEGGAVTDQKEVDVKVSDFDKMLEILELMNLKPTKYQETLREEWGYKGVEIVIDTWPGLQPYIEIEAHSEDEVKEVAEKLGFDWEKKIITSNVEIFCKVYNLNEDEVLKRLDYITFEKIPF
jgi:adenylate cyclase class 2